MTDTGTRVEAFEYSEPPSIEPGVYPGKLIFVEEITHEKFGLRWRWHFVVNGMAEDGGDFPISKWTSPYLSRGSKANEIVKAMRGRKLERGEKLGTELYGKPCQLVVSRDDGEGWNRLDNVLPPVGPKAAPAQAKLVDVAAVKAAAVAADPDYAAWLASRATLEPSADEA